MSNNVTFQSGTPATAPSATVIETQDQGGGVQRQVMAAGPYAYTILTPHQKNVSIASATSLTAPTGATYAVVHAIGGPAYFTYDGVAPTTSSYVGKIAQDSFLELDGAATIAAFQAIGTTMSVAYWK